MDEKRINRGILFSGVSVLVFLVYYPVLNSYFVTDDWRLIYISSPLSTGSILDFFTSSGGWYAGLYRPLVKMSLFTDYSLYHLDQAGYHATNLMLHIVCAILLFYFAKLLTDSEMTGIFAAFIFAVQPISTEAVSWISGRGDIIFTLFYLLACVSFLKHLSSGNKTRKYLFLSSFFFFLSLLSKESAITLPAVIVLTEYYYRRGSLSMHHRINFMNYIPFVFVLILYAFIKIFIVGGGTLNTKTGLSVFLGAGYHFIQLFAPVNIDAFNFSNKSGFILNSIIVLNFAFLLLAYLFFYIDKKKDLPFILYCVIWILITSFPLYLSPGARYMYIPSAASSMLIGFIMVHVLNAEKAQFPGLTKILLPVLMISMIITSSVRIIQKNRIYNFAGAISEKIVTQLKDRYPRFIPGSVLYFINFSTDWIKDTETWVIPIPVMGMAVRVAYGDASLIVYSELENLSTSEEKLQFLQRNSMEKYIKDGKHCYIFEYENGNVVDVTDTLTGKINLQS